MVVPTEAIQTAPETNEGDAVRFLPNLQSLRPYLARYRRRIIWGYLFILLQSGTSLAIPWLLKRGIDGLERGVGTHFLLATAGWILLAAAASGVFLFLKRWILIGVSRWIEYDLRNGFFRHFQGLSLSFYQRSRTGDLMARATNDLNAVRDVVGPGLMYGLTTSTVVVAAFFLMLRLDPVLTGATLIPFPLMAVLVSRFAQEVHRRSRIVQDEYGVLSNGAQENIAGIRVVKTYAQETAEQAHFARLNRRYMDRNLDLIRYRALFHGSVGLLLGAGSLLLLWIGGIRVIRGAVTLGELVAFMGYLSQLTWPFIAVGWVISLLQRGEAAMQRILEVWHTDPEIEGGDRQLDGSVRGDLVFERVSFRYPGGREVLSEIDLHVPAGSTLGLVGRTGSGKSTLVQLIPRLFDPTHGRILLDGTDVRELSLASLRLSIGVAPQDPFLFSDTLEENIRFGSESATRGEVEEAASKACLEPDLAGFGQGLATRVGERGVTLSGGQRQRMALARAILKDPAILILDDALSAVDKSTEQSLMNELRGVARNRTTIIIAHRISTVRDADQIVVLDHGRIVERGTHESLLRQRGIYADLARRQALAEELEETDVGA